MEFEAAATDGRLERTEKMKTAKHHLAAAIMSLALIAPVSAATQVPGRQPGVPATGRGNLVRQLFTGPVTAQAVVTGNGIEYHNGAVMHDSVNVYYIWYGDWTKAPKGNAILTDLAKNLGNSSYYKANTTYGDTVGNVNGVVNYVSAIADTGSFGTALPDVGPWTLVSNAISAGTLPADPNGVYIVLGAPNVSLNGFLTAYCGWHNVNDFNGIPIRHLFIGNPAANPSACSAQTGSSPNGDPNVDAMASILVHELSETVTNPDLTAWWDSLGLEVGDKCAWSYGPTYTASNGSMANVRLGLRDYLIQQTWVNAGGGYCATSYDNSPDFTLGVNPITQTVAPGGTTGSYTMSATGTNGWFGTLTYSVIGGLPAGASARVSGNGITLATTSSVAPGTYTFTIQGTDGLKTHTVGAYLVVAVPSFTLSISPASQSKTRPTTGTATATYVVTVTPVAGFTGTVNLTASGSTTGLTVALSSATITGSGTVNLTATLTSNAKKGNRTLTVTGTSGTKTVSANATLAVN